jgi:hypothetical protein
MPDEAKYAEDVPTPYLRVGPKRRSCKSNQVCQDRICVGDCDRNSDCPETSVCVQNPSKALGPCIGDPQGDDQFRADKTMKPERREFVFNNVTSQEIDYCIPACQKLLQYLEDAKKNPEVTEELYEKYCLAILQVDETQILRAMHPTKTNVRTARTDHYIG